MRSDSREGAGQPTSQYTLQRFLLHQTTVKLEHLHEGADVLYMRMGCGGQ